MASTVAEVMDERMIVAHWHEAAPTARDRLADPAPAIMVVDGDRVVAMVARDKFERAVAEPATHAGRPIHLRDLFTSPVWYVYTHDDLDVARSTLAASADGALAVVDAHARVVGVLTEALLPPLSTPEHGRAPATPNDRHEESQPRLTVYAPWAVVTGETTSSGPKT
ncbi:MAG: hypothetical protein ACOCYE_12345 [Pseudomonadota bacterium]